MVCVFSLWAVLLINQPEHKNVENYYRELDIENAVAVTRYMVDEVTYTRTVFFIVSPIM